LKNTNDKGTLTQIDFAKIPAAAAAAAAAAAVAVAAAAMEQQQRILLSRFRTRNGYQYWCTCVIE
jgi:precorrin-4 methylase